MRDIERARQALAKAEDERDEIRRTIWLAKAADYATARQAVLVGGAAVNLQTGSYRPTDIDMCAYLDDSDRAALRTVGFVHTQGDHFEFTFSDGDIWLLEFPESWVDGTTIRIDLGGGESLAVISPESLIVDRTMQATDGTTTTFEEAVRLYVAIHDDVDWSIVVRDLTERNQASPLRNVTITYERLLSAVTEVRNRGR